MTQSETLDEYTLRVIKDLTDPMLRNACKHFLRLGAKWQKEQMYTKEDLEEAYSYSKNFNYPNTCPRIDKNIKNFQSDLTTHLNALVEELNPMFYSTNESWRFIEGFSDIIYIILPNLVLKILDNLIQI
jgi:hypothetical protein